MTSGKKKGLIIVHTGDGKGKTTAAFGLALRAAGQDLRVLILQFMKGQQNTGEFKAIGKFNLPITIRQLGRPGFIRDGKPGTEDIAGARAGLDAFRQALSSGDYDMIVLDEINMAVSFGLLPVEDVLKAVAARPDNVHLVLTGRNAHAELVAVADLVTEMREIKHPYQKGVKAQQGIEF
jgi:cob(I)alamin adenosyltransferase